MSLSFLNTGFFLELVLIWFMNFILMNGVFDNKINIGDALTKFKIRLPLTSSTSINTLKKHQVKYYDVTGWYQRHFAGELNTQVGVQTHNVDWLNQVIQDLQGEGVC